MQSNNQQSGFSISFCCSHSSREFPPRQNVIKIFHHYFHPFFKIFQLIGFRDEDGIACHAQPAHTITLLSPLVVVNLLPYELLWELKAVGQSGIIKPGKSTSIHTVNASAGFQISFRTENFVHSSDIVIGAPPHNFNTRLRLYDSANRLLLLQVNESCLSYLAQYLNSTVVFTGQGQFKSSWVCEAINIKSLLDCQ